jgi:hypothetical protein
VPLETLGDLLQVVHRLPIEERADAIERLERILELDPEPRQVALGLLALDLAPAASRMAAADRAADLVSA